MEPQTSNHKDTPRLVWQSQDDCYRIVLTSGGPLDFVNRDGRGELPVGQYWVLERRTGADMLGQQRWDAVHRFGDAQAWHGAFTALAAEYGMFGTPSVTWTELEQRVAS